MHSLFLLARTQHAKNILILFVFLIATCIHAYAQMKIGFRYNIKRNSYGVNYTTRDTTRDVNMNITGFVIHNYIAGNINATTSVTDNSGTYPVTTFTEPGLLLCANKLKAALTQIDGNTSGKVYINFWGITSESTTCTTNTYINRSLRLGEFYYQIDLPTHLSDVTTYIAVHHASTEIGIATIPFKYRFGKKKDTIFVPNQASASINAGIYLGRKWGTTRFYADKSKTKNAVSFTAGVFVAPSVVELSQENAFPSTDTEISKQLKVKTNQFLVSTGAAAMLTLGDINVGLFGGIDLPIASLTKNWYYANKFWIGFGIGYKLTILGEKS